MNNGNHHQPLVLNRTVRHRVAFLSGTSASRCFQCAACASICDLSDGESSFPRRQIQYAQLGLIDRMKSDPAIWLCHQCNDCSVHCPKNAKPGDIMAAMRALLISENSVFKAVGRMYERIDRWWPVTVLVPVLFWLVFYLIFFGVDGFRTSPRDFQFETLVPHWMIYIVNIPVFTGALIALGISGNRAWNAWGATNAGLGMYISAFAKSLIDIARHQKMTVCNAARQRRTGHFMVMWGVIGALVTTAFIAVLLLFSPAKLPLPFLHPLKVVGNIAGILILAGGVLVLLRRWQNSAHMGRTSAVDYFFILLIFAVAATGMGAQLFRITHQQPVALGIYLVHLGLVLSLFLSLPFSRFSHMWYRLLAVTRAHLIPPSRITRFNEPVSAID